MSKKIHIISTRIDGKCNTIIEELAKKENRPIASMTRILILETLKKRNEFKDD